MLTTLAGDPGSVPKNTHGGSEQSVCVPTPSSASTSARHTHGIYTYMQTNTHMYNIEINNSIFK